LNARARNQNRSPRPFHFYERARSALKSWNLEKLIKHENLGIIVFFPGQQRARIFLGTLNRLRRFDSGNSKMTGGDFSGWKNISPKNFRRV